MATPTIPNGEEYFFPIIYEGNGAGQRVGKFVPFTDNGTIDNSCIFNNVTSSAGHYLRKASMSAGNKQVATFSAWIKFTGPFSTSSDLFTNYGGILEQGNGSWTSGSHFMFWQNRGRLDWYHNGSTILRTNRYLQDSSKWYHIMWALDVTQTDAADRLKIYIDGKEETSFNIDSRSSLTKDTDLTYINASGQELNVGGMPSGNGYQDLNCYMAEVNYVDGTALTPSTFGLTDTSTGRWIPKTLSGITYGTNGFRLEFGDSSALGDDTSGNTYDLTANNLASTDQTTGSPTQNHATLAANPTAGTATLSEGNLKIAGTGSGVYGVRRATFLINSNDSNGYYFEAKNVGSSTDNINIGLISSQNALSASAYGGSNSYGIASRGSGGSNQYWRVLGGSTDVTTSVSHASNDVIGVAIKQGKIWFAINNTWVLSGDPANGTNSFFDMSSKASEFQIAFNVFQNNTLDVNFGQKSLAYTAPTGFSALQQDNLPETAKGISGLVWTKNRDSTDNHQLYDSSRGKQLVLPPNATTAEATVTGGLQRFLAGGQQIEDNVAINTSGESFVTWNWVANGGTTETNTDGSITSTVQANTTAGFSIVEFTTPSSTQDFTVGHGLSVAPRVFFFKRTDSTSGWAFYHQDVFDTYGNQYTLFLNTSGASYAPNPGIAMYPSATTATTFSLRAGASIATSANCVAYCFNEVEGFSKFGKYSANNSADGPFVYLGFKPKFLIIKANGAISWYIMDATRNTFNPVINGVTIDNPQVEFTVQFKVDFLSNGFKIRNDSSVYGASTNNTSYSPYYYMAFAEHPFVGDGTSPVTAR